MRYASYVECFTRIRLSAGGLIERSSGWIAGNNDYGYTQLLLLLFA